MFAKSTILLALFAVTAQVAVATPPACLLAALNTFQSPADLPTLCGTDSSKVQAAIRKICGDNTQAALDAYASTCKSAGKTVSTASSSGSSTASGSVSASASGSSSASGTGAPYPVVYTSTYYDTVCSCTKTAAISSTGVAGSTGFATGTAAPTGTSPSGSGAGSATSPAATGSPILPSATKGPGGSTTPPKFTGAATKNIGSFAAVLIPIVGLAVAL